MRLFARVNSPSVSTNSEVNVGRHKKMEPVKIDMMKDCRVVFVDFMKEHWPLVQAGDRIWQALEKAYDDAYRLGFQDGKYNG